MEYFTTLIPETLSQAISFTLLHSLWQITLVSIIFFIAVKLFAKEKSSLKYNLAIMSLFSCLGITMLSFVYFFIEYTAASNAIDPFIGQQFMTQEFASTFVSGKFSFEKFMQENISLISGCWLIGSALFFARFGSGVIGLYNLKQNAIASSDKRLHYIMNGLKNKLRLTKEVQIQESSYITNPIVLGYIKPVILFPVAMCAQLSMDELEAVIAHELAHIKRNDFIINLIQSFAEAILYYHPLVWWLSKIIKEERENCCDDIAVGLTADKINYAKTLIKIQELSSTPSMSLALAFTGNKNQFKNRIMRILNQPSSSQFLREKLIAIALLFSFIIAFAHNDTIEIIEANTTDCELEDILSSDNYSNLDYSLIIEDDTLPNKKNTVKVFKQKNNEDVEISIEDGEITRFKVNGKEVPKEEIENYSDVIEIEENGKIKVWGDSLRFNKDGFNFDTENWFSESAPSELEVAELLEETMHNLSDLMEENRFNIEDLKNKKIEIHRLEEFFEDGNYPLAQGEKPFRFGDKNIDVEALLAEVLPKNFSMDHFSFPNGAQGRNIFPQLKNNNENFFSGSNLKDKISNALSNDGFLTEGENKVELSGKHMKINGDKQPKNIWNKYKKIYEKNLGTELTKDSKVFFNIEYKKRSYRHFETM